MLDDLGYKGIKVFSNRCILKYKSLSIIISSDGKYYKNGTVKNMIK